MLCGVGFFSILFPKVYNHIDATVQKEIFLGPFTLAQPFFLESASVALVCDFRF